MVKRFSFSGSLFIIGTLLHWTPVWSFDLWWELLESRWVWQHKTFPITPIFTYTLTDFPYIAHEWASGMIFFGIHNLFGARGLLLFVSAVFGLFGVLFFKLLRKAGADLWPAWLYSLLFMLIAHLRFPLRPELFSYFFMLAVLSLQGAPRGWRSVLCHWALFALWSNFHGQFAFGLVYLCLVFITTGSAETGGRLLASCLGLFCNPYSWRIFLIPLMYFTRQDSLFAVATEGQRSLLFTSIVSALLLPTLGLLFWNWWVTREARPPGARLAPSTARKVALPSGTAFPWRDTALTLAFGLQALRVNRVFVVFCIVAMPILYLQAAKALKNGFPRIADRRPATRAVLLSWALVLMVVLLRAPAVARTWAHPLDLRSLPEKAASFFERIQARGKVYNSFNFGGYLEWKLYPNIAIFYDERYPYASLEHDEDEARKSPEAWATFIKRYDADFACLDWVWEGGLHPLLWPAWGKAWEQQGIRSPYESLFPRKDWTLIYWDDKALIFARNLPKNRGIIRQYALRYTEPLSWQNTLEQVRQGKIPRNAVLREVEEIQGRAGKNWVSNLMQEQLASS